MEISVGVVFKPQHILRDFIWHWTPVFLDQKTARVSVISFVDKYGCWW